MPRLDAVHLVTLAVDDLAAATRFYEALGWRRASVSTPEVSFFHGRGCVLALWGRRDLAEDARMPLPGAGAAAVALACNVPAREDVDHALATAEAAGARVTKPAEDTFWGGRSGYFLDPDDHLWEVAWNPHFPFREDGTLALPP